MRSQSLGRRAWLAWSCRSLRPRLLVLRLRKPPFWMLCFTCQVPLSRFHAWIQPGECGSLNVKGLCFSPRTALRVQKSLVWGSDDREVAGEEKGKDPGFGVRPEVRGAGGRLRPGLGAWQGREPLGYRWSWLLEAAKLSCCPSCLEDSSPRRKRRGLGSGFCW